LCGQYRVWPSVETDINKERQFEISMSVLHKEHNDCVASIEWPSVETDINKE
jgi:hypothetical protein